MAQAPESDAPAKGIDTTALSRRHGSFRDRRHGGDDAREPDADDSHPWGTTVNSFTAVSLDPPLVLVAIGRERSIHPIIERTRRFAVNILGEDTQAISDCFSGAPSALPALSRSATPTTPWASAGLPVLERGDRLRRLRGRTGHRGRRPHHLPRRASSRPASRDDLGLAAALLPPALPAIERAATPDLRGKPDRSARPTQACAHRRRQRHRRSTTPSRVPDRRV